MARQSYLALPTMACSNILILNDLLSIGRFRSSGRRASVIIAIDGPAASGKGTLARRLATHFGLPHLDTGLLYRATARALLDAGRSLEHVPSAIAAARSLALIDFDETRLRG